jgi:membrane protein DedA with SNARE-associated domain
MGFFRFSILTVVGAAIWCSVLAWLGGKIGRQSLENPLQNPDALIHAVKGESHWIIAIVLLVCVLYFVAMKLSGATEKAAD